MKYRRRFVWLLLKIDQMGTLKLTVIGFLMFLGYFLSMKELYFNSSNISKAVPLNSVDYLMDPDYGFFFKYQHIENTSVYLRCVPHVSCEQDFKGMIEMVELQTPVRFDKMEFMDLDTFCILDIPVDLLRMEKSARGVLRFTDDLQRVMVRKFKWKVPDENFTKIIEHHSRSFRPRLAILKDACLIPNGFVLDCRNFFSTSTQCADPADNLYGLTEALEPFRNDSTAFYGEEILTVDDYTGELNLHVLEKLASLPMERIVRNPDVFFSWHGTLDDITLQALSFLGIGKERIIINDVVCGANVYIPATKACDRFPEQNLHRLRDIMHRELQITGEKSLVLVFPGPYNDQELVYRLTQRYGERVVLFPETKSFIKIMDLVFHTQIFIGMADPGLSWVLYGDVGSSLIEFHAQNTRFLTMEVAIKAGMDYYGIYASLNQTSGQNEVYIDIEEIETLVGTIFG